MPLMARMEPIQSIGSDLLVGTSGGSRSARLPKTTNPSKALVIVSAIGCVCLQEDTCIKIKSHFHGVSSANRPANRAPKTPPTGAPAPKNPRLRLRVLPGGRVVPMIAMALGTIMAAPMPLKALTLTKAIKFLQNPLISDKTIHHAAPPSRMFLWPYMEPRRPVMITKAPEVNLEVDICQLIDQESEAEICSRVRGRNPRCLTWFIHTKESSEEQSTSNTKTE